MKRHPLPPASISLFAASAALSTIHRPRLGHATPAALRSPRPSARKAGPPPFHSFRVRRRPRFHPPRRLGLCPRPRSPRRHRQPPSIAPGRPHRSPRPRSPLRHRQPFQINANNANHSVHLLPLRTVWTGRHRPAPVSSSATAGGEHSLDATGPRKGLAHCACSVLPRFPAPS